jgi:hypothetical protein
MTNAEINQAAAIENLKAGKLNEFEIKFVNSIKDMSKKELRALSYKQYDILRKIANK